jgi:hypothetical protein
MSCGGVLKNNQINQRLATLLRSRRAQGLNSCTTRGNLNEVEKLPVPGLLGIWMVQEVGHDMLQARNIDLIAADNPRSFLNDIADAASKLGRARGARLPQ